MTNYPKKLSEPEILRTRIMKGKKNRKPQQIGKSKQNTTQKYTNSKIQNKIPQGKTGWETTKNVQKLLENVFLPKNYRRGQHQPIFSPCSSMAAVSNFAKKTTASPIPWQIVARPTQLGWARSSPARPSGRPTAVGAPGPAPGRPGCRWGCCCWGPGPPGPPPPPRPRRRGRRLERTPGDPEYEASDFICWD